MFVSKSFILPPVCLFCYYSDNKIINKSSRCNQVLNQKLPFKDSIDSEVQTENVLGVKEMVVPIIAGILSALRRVIARRVSLKVLSC